MVNKNARDKGSDRDVPEKKHRKTNAVTTYELPVSKISKEDRDVYMVCMLLQSNLCIFLMNCICFVNKIVTGCDSGFACVNLFLIG